MMQLALYKLFERDPARVTRIVAAALDLYGGEVPWTKTPQS